MKYTRRNTLRAIGTGGLLGLAVCSSITSGADQEYAPVVLRNDHSSKHMMSVAITTVPKVKSGFTEYFSEVWHLRPGNDKRFEQGLAFTDYEPELTALVALEDETTKRSDFSFDFDLRELQVVITEEKNVEISPKLPEEAETASGT